jgi:hypothetical protein
MLEESDERVLSELKMALCPCVQVFEVLECKFVKQDCERLLETLKQIPKILEGYYGRVLARVLVIFLEQQGG